RTCYIPSSVSRFSFLLGPAICEIYPLSLHDALPIFGLIFKRQINQHEGRAAFAVRELRIDDGRQDAGIEMMPVQADADICRREIDRKSTRLNSSHVKISYAVFCLKKKKKKVAIQNRK